MLWQFSNGYPLTGAKIDQYLTLAAITAGLLHMVNGSTQCNHLSGKPGNVRETDSCYGNVRDFTKSRGNVGKKSCRGKLA